MHIGKILFAVCALSVVQIIGCASKPSPAPESMNRPIIDTHIHLYDTARPEGVPWPPPTDRVLYRPVFPKDFNKIAKKNGVTGVVIVEASHLIEDNQWLFDITKSESLYIGIVGHLDVQSKDFPKLLDRFVKNPRFVGIRLRPKDLKGPLINETSIANLKYLAKSGKSLDILLGGVTLAQADQIATKVPDLRIVLDHLAGTTVTATRITAIQAKNIHMLAKHPNVMCKISGVFQQSKRQPSPTSVKFYKSVLDEIWNAFGEDRLFYGSNWPVTDRGGSYKDQLAVIVDYFADKGAKVQDKILAGNATRFYKLK